MVPADDQAMVFPCASVMVIIVLLKVAFTCATPEAIFLRSRRRTRAGSFPIPDPLKRAALRPQGQSPVLLRRRDACAGWMRDTQAPTSLLLLARNRLGRTLACAGVGMGALPANGQAAAVSQPTVAPKVHQPLDVHGHL